MKPSCFKTEPAVVVTAHLQAIEEMVQGMQPLVASSTSPWLHALYAWACTQQLSVNLHQLFAQLRPDKVGVMSAATCPHNPAFSFLSSLAPG
jgi:hypothetical protein